MLEEIIQNRYAVTAVILFGIGFTNLMLQQNPSQTTSPKVLHHLHLGPLALYHLDLVLGCLGTSSHLLGRYPLLLYK